MTKLKRMAINKWIAIFFLFNPAITLSQEIIDQTSSTIVEPFLISGKLADGETKLISELTLKPGDDQLEMELGFIKFLRSVERMAQTLYRFGPNESLAMGQIPFLRLPVPRNPDPDKVQLQDARAMIQQLIDDLDQAEAMLAKVESDKVKLPIKVMRIRLDINGDGQATDKEILGPVLNQYLGVRRSASDQVVELMDRSIHFDRSDVDWMRGYCCLLRAMGEVILAYDQTELWEVTAHRFFAKGQSKFKFLVEEQTDDNDFWIELRDVIAGIHNIQFPVKEAQRLKKAHRHLLDTISHSRIMWKRINAEVDDDQEWIPSPTQSNPFTDVRITRQMHSAWNKFLNEGEDLLEGKLLIPFWRGTNERRGVNLYKVFHEPQKFDLVLWIHGSGAAPFLEFGKCSDPDTWNEFQRIFRGNFFGFAVWFN
ncbi:MAG: hypothetical protein AAF939_14080 [Planctomycetota bacterium]